MLVVCSIVLAIGSDIIFLTKADVEGKILKESNENYLVDFSKGVTKYAISGKPEDYNKKLVKKQECVKE